MKPAPSSDDGLARALFQSTPSSFDGHTFGCPSSFGHGAPHLARSFGQGIPPSTQGGASQSQSSTWSFITPSLSNPSLASALSNQRGFHPQQPTFNPQGYGSGAVSTPYFGMQGTGRGSINPPSAFNSLAATPQRMYSDLTSSDRSSLGSTSNRSSLGSYNSRQSLGGRRSDQQQPLGGGGIRDQHTQNSSRVASNATQPPRSFQMSTSNQSSLGRCSEQQSLGNGISNNRQP